MTTVDRFMAASYDPAMSDPMMEGIAVLEADRSGDTSDTMQTWSFPDLEVLPVEWCGLNPGDEMGLLRFWRQDGNVYVYAWSEKVGKPLEHTNADSFALVFSSRERHPARARALMEEVFVPAFRAGGPMKLLQAALLLQASGKSPDGMDYLKFAGDRGGAPPGTVELGAGI